MIGVYIVEDQDMVRAGFAMILEAEADITVVGESADGTVALAEIESVTPDVCLVDIRIPGIDGLEFTRRLVARPDSPKVVIVTTFDEPEQTERALRSGAKGFLLKDAGPVLLIEAVRAAVGDDAVISPSVARRMLEDLRARPERINSPSLSPRQREVLQLVCSGATNKQVATALFLSVSRVKQHLSELQSLTNTSNRTELVAWAYRTGLTGEANL